MSFDARLGPLLDDHVVKWKLLRQTRKIMQT